MQVWHDREKEALDKAMQNNRKVDPWAGLTGSGGENPFSGGLDMKQGEGLTSFRSRLAQQVKDAQAKQDNILDTGRQTGKIRSVAEGLTEKVSLDQYAGQAAEDVDKQYANQDKALQLRQTRMGLDPSQMQSVTSQRMGKIAQASARAGAMQAARRAGEAQNMSNYNNNLGLGANLVNNNTKYQMQNSMNDINNYRQQGMGVDSAIGRANQAINYNNSVADYYNNQSQDGYGGFKNASNAYNAQQNIREAQLALGGGSAFDRVSYGNTLDGQRQGNALNEATQSANRARRGHMRGNMSYNSSNFNPQYKVSQTDYRYK